MAKAKEKPFKRKVVKPKKEKVNPLDTLCNEDQRKRLQEIARRGACVILTGDQFAPYQEFFKGIRMYMKNPTFNGVAMYVTHVVYKNNWTRPLYLLTLNDAGNANILHSIREIKGRAVYSRYVYHPED